MKTRIHFITVFLLFGIYMDIHSQDVFPTSDAIWNIRIDGKEYYYGLSGDTIIEDQSYNKLYLLNDTTLSLDLGDVYVGGFRQDGKKVWFRPYLPDDYYIHHGNLQYPGETLLYDFSKNMGDTIWHNIVPNHSQLYYWEMKDSISASIIESIDIDEQGRKTYHTNSFYNYGGELLAYMGRSDSWAEGVGSIQHGLFWFLSSKTMGGYPIFRLDCFKQGYEVKYMDANCNSCFSWTSSILKKNSIPLEVVHENSCIRFKGELSVFPCELRLFSPMGQLILEKKLQSDKEEIPVNQLDGIYLYQVHKGKEIVKTGKIRINN